MLCGTASVIAFYMGIKRTRKSAYILFYFSGAQMIVHSDFFLTECHDEASISFLQNPIIMFNKFEGTIF